LQKVTPLFLALKQIEQKNTALPLSAKVAFNTKLEGRGLAYVTSIPKDCCETSSIFKINSIDA